MIIQKPSMPQLQEDKIRNKNIRKTETGFITLVSVLLVGAVGLSIALSTVLLGVGASRTNFAIEQSGKAKALANACAEEALEKIRESTPFTGSGNLSLGGGTCSYTVTSTGDTTRSVASSGTIGTITRKVNITVTQINPEIIVNPWVEAAD